jgi:cell division protein FtsW (lipid II flippase)
LAERGYGSRRQNALSARQRAAWFFGLALIVGVLTVVPFRWYERIVMSIAVLTLILVPVALLLGIVRRMRSRSRQNGD